MTDDRERKAREAEERQERERREAERIRIEEIEREREREERRESDQRIGSDDWEDPPPSSGRMTGRILSRSSRKTRKHRSERAMAQSWDDGDYYKASFSIGKCRRYHERLQAFYDGWSNRISIVNAFLSGSAFLTLVGWQGHQDRHCLHGHRLTGSSSGRDASVL
jgi:hypothetical protein